MKDDIPTMHDVPSIKKMPGKYVIFIVFAVILVLMGIFAAIIIL